MYDGQRYSVKHANFGAGYSQDIGLINGAGFLSSPFY